MDERKRPHLYIVSSYTEGPIPIHQERKLLKIVIKNTSNTGLHKEQSMLPNQLSSDRWSQRIRHIALISLLTLGLTAGFCGLVESAYASTPETTETDDGIPGNRAGGGTRLISAPMGLY